MKILELKPPGTLWATPGLLWDSFTFTFRFLIVEECVICLIELFKAKSQRQRTCWRCCQVSRTKSAQGCGSCDW